MRTTSFRHQRMAGRALIRVQGGPILYVPNGSDVALPIKAIVNDKWKAEDPQNDAGTSFSVADLIALVHVDDVPVPVSGLLASRSDAIVVEGRTYQVTAAREHKMNLWRMALVEPSGDE